MLHFNDKDPYISYLKFHAFEAPNNHLRSFLSKSFSSEVSKYIIIQKTLCVCSKFAIEETFYSFCILFGSLNMYPLQKKPQKSRVKILDLVDNDAT